MNCDAGHAVFSPALDSYVIRMHVSSVVRVAVKIIIINYPFYIQYALDHNLQH